MKKIKIITLFFTLILTTSCGGQSIEDELNGLYGNKFGQLIYFNNGQMYFYKSTFLHVFQKMEMEKYTYSNKKVVYKYDDISLNHEKGKVTSLNHRGREYVRFKTIEDIIQMKNLGLKKIHKGINENYTLSMADLEVVLKDDTYLRHTNILVDKISIDDMIINTHKAVED